MSFRYESGDPPVLEDVSFNLEPGKRLAIVGPSGAGKSTLANLILPFWDPTSGQIKLGGHDIRRYAQDDLRELISVVTQDTSSTIPCAQSAPRTTGSGREGFEASRSARPTIRVIRVGGTPSGENGQQPG